MKFSTIASTFALAGPAIARQIVSTFDFFGINESGLEQGNSVLPGQYGHDYSSPSTQDIQTLIEQGYNIFRIPFIMERMNPGTITSPINTTYLGYLTDTVSAINNAGAYAVLMPWNSGRYPVGGSVVSTDDFTTFWHTLAGYFATEPKVIFDTNNEYNLNDGEGGDAAVVRLNQAAINGIRNAGATQQFIFVEGNGYTPAWNWAANAVGMEGLTDPSNKLIYEMHLYFDYKHSGKTPDCSKPALDQLDQATQWLRENGKVGIMGEFAAAPTKPCSDAATGMLERLKAATDVWMGALWWVGKQQSFYSASDSSQWSVFNPQGSPAYTFYNQIFQSYRTGLTLQSS